MGDVVKLVSRFVAAVLLLAQAAAGARGATGVGEAGFEGPGREQPKRRAAMHGRLPTARRKRCWLTRGMRAARARRDACMHGGGARLLVLKKRYANSPLEKVLGGATASKETLGLTGLMGPP